jgi:hypothetical protein
MTSGHILVVLQVVAAGALILVGSLVEAYGYGLSLGTSWPYRYDLLRLAFRGDPEAWHRIIATCLGANAVILALLVRDTNVLSGLALSAGAALLGVATLNVLAGKAPALLHGLHGVLAYGALLAYVCEIAPGPLSVWARLDQSIPLRGFLFMVFLGGMVTGQRGFETPIGAFVLPRTRGQWVFVIHLVGWLGLVLTLAYSVRTYSAALLLALLQGLIGFGLYQSVNAAPARPGLFTVLHQIMGLFIFFSIVFAWEVHIHFPG